jgi:hypothetical protein
VEEKGRRRLAGRVAHSKEEMMKMRKRVTHASCGVTGRTLG